MSIIRLRSFHRRHAVQSRVAWFQVSKATPLVLDLFDRMPFPHPPHLGIGGAEMVGVGEEFMRHHRGVVFQRHGRGEVDDDRAALGQLEHFGDAAIDCLDIVPMRFGEPVERDVFARVVHFLPHESADFLGQLGIGAIAVRLYRFDEIGLAAREGGAERVVPCGPEGFACPPARGVAATVEALVANLEGQAFGSRSCSYAVQGELGWGVHWRLRTVNTDRSMPLTYINVNNV